MAADPEVSREPHAPGGVPSSRAHDDSLDTVEPDEPGDRYDAREHGGPLESLDSLPSLDTLEPIEPLPPGDESQSFFRALRPARQLKVWQLVPIVALAVGGSLMFAFPLAFESGDAGPVVAMLGLLLCCCSAGWGLMAARRIGRTWPGLPPRGSGGRADWRFVAGYAAVIVVLAVLAVWRVARLR
jgi:hypothetical protein